MLVSSGDWSGRGTKQLLGLIGSVKGAWRSDTLDFGQ